MTFFPMMTVVFEDPISTSGNCGTSVRGDNSIMIELKKTVRLVLCVPTPVGAAAAGACISARYSRKRWRELGPCGVDEHECAKTGLATPCQWTCTACWGYRWKEQTISQDEERRLAPEGLKDPMVVLSASLYLCVPRLPLTRIPGTSSRTGCQSHQGPEETIRWRTV